MSGARGGQRAIAANRERRGGCLASTVFALLLVSGAVVVHAFFLEPSVHFVQSRHWVATPCTVVESRYEAAGPDSDSYIPEIRFTYRYEGVAHQSLRVWFIRPAAETLFEARSLVRRYPKGKEATCWVNPRDPAIAVLDRSFKPELLIGLVPLAVALIGLGGLLLTLMPRAQEKRIMSRSTHPLPSGSVRRSRPLRQADAPLVLRAAPKVAPIAILVVLAVIWNAATAVLVREVIDNWRSGVPGCYGWFLSFFALPFVLVGLGLIVAVVRAAGRLFYPRPILRLEPGLVAMGQEAELSWTFTGRPERLERVRVLLEGREEATYWRDNRACTEIAAFMTVPLLDTIAPDQIRAGRLRFRVPAEGVPTFQSTGSEIVWVLRVVSDLEDGKATVHEFEIDVGPHKS